MAKPKEKEKRRATFQKHEIPFSKKNFIVLIIGVITIFIGFYLMAVGEVDSFIAVTLAPILLFIAYVIIIPYAILKKFKNGEN
ncbi:Protein of unknown function (DUF3098) [Candidatus Thermokryptus mobilis]|uniref:DUF3098 domain-containing protein n=1 Tax=Candidatus Thermokryptus mobilis TaxID=1643428 RepID=A0A0S4N9R4_9BACT|nr:DUF3098 domain-containing protein [Candidatus Thermokryptus mobilis]CUU07608.1 Protein of unknown function (DUF3098) [Candidatus Thermokryptus mobilis]